MLGEEEKIYGSCRFFPRVNLHALILNTRCVRMENSDSFLKTFNSNQVYEHFDDNFFVMTFPAFSAFYTIAQKLN